MIIKFLKNSDIASKSLFAAILAANKDTGVYEHNISKLAHVITHDMFDLKTIKHTIRDILSPNNSKFELDVIMNNTVYAFFNWLTAERIREYDVEFTIDADVFKNILTSNFNTAVDNYAFTWIMFCKTCNTRQISYTRVYEYYNTNQNVVNITNSVINAIKIVAQYETMCRIDEYL